MRKISAILASFFLLLLTALFTSQANAMVVVGDNGGAKSHPISVEVYPDSSTTDQTQFITSYLLGRTIASFYRNSDRPINVTCTEIEGYIEEGNACKVDYFQLPDGNYTLKVPVITGYSINLHKRYWSYNSFTGNFADVDTNISGGSYSFRTQDIFPKYAGVDFTVTYTKLGNTSSKKPSSQSTAVKAKGASNLRSAASRIRLIPRSKPQMNSRLILHGRVNTF